jgi:predicted secreted protein
MEKIKGKDIFLSLKRPDGTIMPIGCAQSAEMSFATEMLEATCKADGGWYEGVPDKKSWSASLSGLYTVQDMAEGHDVEDFFDMWIGDELLIINFGTLNTGDTQYEGQGYLNNLTLTGADGPGTYSASFTGIGPVGKVAQA